MDAGSQNSDGLSQTSFKENYEQIVKENATKLYGEIYTFEKQIGEINKNFNDGTYL